MNKYLHIFFLFLTLNVISQKDTSRVSEWDVTNAKNDPQFLNGTITSFTVNNAQYCYTLQDSAQQLCDSFPSGANIFVIRDDDGNQYNIQVIPGPPTITGPSNYLKNTTDNLQISDSLTVTFEASSNQAFGFDKKEYTAYIPNYEVFTTSSNAKYFIPYKSIGEGQTDVVLANIQINNFNASKLSFKTQNGTVLNATNQGTNQYVVSNIPATANCVYAYYNNKKVGKVNIVSLKSITKKVVIVPVNGASNSITAAQLNGVYKQANVAWTVSTPSAFNFNLGNDGLQAADATLLTKYSAEMRALRDAYKQATPNYDKDAYYIFVIPKFSIAELKGYMVRGRAVGFVTANATAKEIAHELAHGAFGLEHTFPKIDKETSNNLLDYANGEKLTKEQWMEMQNPSTAFNWNDGEEDASLSIDQNKIVFEWLNKIKTACKKSVTINLNKSVYAKTENTNLMGVAYDYIEVLGFYDNTNVTINPKNNIIQNIQSGEEAALLDKLKSKGLLWKITVKVDNSTVGFLGKDNYTEYMMTLCSYWRKAYTQLLSQNKTSATNVIGMLWDESFFNDNSYITVYPTTNKIYITHKTRNQTPSSGQDEVTVYDPVLISPINPSKILGVPEGQHILVPGIFLDWLDHKKTLADLGTTATTAIDVLALATGVGELYKATSWGLRGVALLEASVATTDLIFNMQDFRNQIVASFPAGQQAKADSLISKYQTISMCINVAVAGKGLLLNFNQDCSKYKQLFDEANTSLANNLAPTEYNKLKKLRDEINSDPNQFAEFIDNTGNVATGVGNLATLISKWDNLSISEAKSLYVQLFKTEVKGVKSTVTQSSVLAEINASSTLVNPYNFAFPIEDFILNHEALFVRVHNSWNPNRPWLISIEEFRTFTSQDDMIKKLALPILDNTGNIVKPAEISIVKLPIGAKVRKSTARPQDWPGQGHQPGGAIQFEIRENPTIPKSWFKPMGNVTDYLN